MHLQRGRMAVSLLEFIKSIQRACETPRTDAREPSLVCTYKKLLLSASRISKYIGYHLLNHVLLLLHLILSVHVLSLCQHNGRNFRYRSLWRALLRIATTYLYSFVTSGKPSCTNLSKRPYTARISRRLDRSTQRWQPRNTRR
jgi:hypothetical protein